MNITPIGININPEATSPIRPLTPKPKAEGSGAVSENSSVSFADILRQAVTNDAAAQRAADNYAIGRSQNLHETMILMEKADISLNLLVTVRNKLMEAYKEVMRMS